MIPQQIPRAPRLRHVAKRRPRGATRRLASSVAIQHFAPSDLGQALDVAADVEERRANTYSPASAFRISGVVLAAGPSSKVRITSWSARGIVADRSSGRNSGCPACRPRPCARSACQAQSAPSRRSLRQEARSTAHPANRIDRSKSGNTERATSAGCASGTGARALTKRYEDRRQLLSNC